MLNYAICASEGAALHEPVLFRGSYTDAFAYARDLGYKGLEIHLRDAAAADAGALAQASAATGVRVAAVATGLAKRVDGLSLIDDDKAGRRAAIERLKGHLDLAARFGCTVIIGSMRANVPSPDRREECYAVLADSIKYLADYIADKNCTIVFEAINRYENNYLNNAAETADFIDRIGSDKVLMLLDTFHMNIEERDMCAPLRDYAKYLGHIHFADNTRWYPGQGQIKFEAIVRTLEEVGYDKWVSMEYLPLPDEATAGRKGMEFLRGL